MAFGLITDFKQKLICLMVIQVYYYYYNALLTACAVEQGPTVAVFGHSWMKVFSSARVTLVKLIEFLQIFL